MRKNLLKNLKMFTLLCTFWVLLSDAYHPHMFINMAISNITILFLINKMNLLPEVRITKKGIKFCIIMFKNIAMSSIFVFNIFKKEKPIFKSGIRTISFKNISTNMGAVLHAAAITMTPGTTVLAIDKEKNQMLVQALDESLFKDVVDPAVTKIVNKK